MAINVNRVVLTGNLTHDPELHNPDGGTPRCRLRLAVNGRRRDSEGNWADKPNYVSVTVWGPPAENCAKYLKRGRAIAVDGRLDWHSWTEGEKTRQAIQVIAETVQFLGSPPPPSTQQQPGAEPSSVDASQPPAVPSDIPEPAPLAGVAAAVATDRDEIPV
jgi:single-strand DNA-binding protein